MRSGLLLRARLEGEAPRACCLCKRDNAECRAAIAGASGSVLHVELALSLNVWGVCRRCIARVASGHGYTEGARILKERIMAAVAS